MVKNEKGSGKLKKAFYCRRLRILLPEDVLSNTPALCNSEAIFKKISVSTIFSPVDSPFYPRDDERD